MSFTWTSHRFSGGALALDLANSVILRFDAERRIDRFADPAAIDGFAEAATRYCAEAVATIRAPQGRKPLLDLREAIDRHFRSQALGAASTDNLATLLEAIAAVLRHDPSDTDARLDMEAAHSALRLLVLPEPDRLKICSNCQWLFLDRSRNRSRMWCDMTVCGNRIKAKRHYRRQKENRA